MNFRRLLTTDTRSVELISGLSLVSASLGYFVGYGQEHRLFQFHQPEFWIILTMLFGLMQVFTIIEEGLDNLRFALCWIAGIFWLWVGLYTINEIIKPTDALSVIMGVFNLYAFVVNVSNIKKNIWN